MSSVNAANENGNIDKNRSFDMSKWPLSLFLAFSSSSDHQRESITFMNTL